MVATPQGSGYRAKVQMEVQEQRETSYLLQVSSRVGESRSILMWILLLFNESILPEQLPTAKTEVG